MHGKIALVRKEGLFLIDPHKDEDEEGERLICSKFSQEDDVDLQGVVRALHSIVKIEEDVTFGDFMMNVVKPNVDFFDLIFDAHSGGCSIQKFLDEMMIKGEAKKDDPVNHLVVSSSGRIDDGEYYEDFDFFGYGKEHEAGHGRYGVGFTPMNEMYDLPLRVDNEFHIQEEIVRPMTEEEVKQRDQDEKDGKRRKVVGATPEMQKLVDMMKDMPPMKHEVKSIITRQRPMTLFECTATMLYEITWYGEPKGRDEKSRDLDDIVQRSKEKRKEDEEDA